MYQLNVILRKEITMTIGEKIRELREKKRWSQKQLAKKAGVSETYIKKYERGEVCPSNQTMYKLAKALGVDITVLIAAKYPIIDAENLKSALEIPAATDREQLIRAATADDTNDSISHRFAIWLRMLREIDDLSVKELADAAGLTWEEIDEYEREEDIPDIIAFSRISDYFNISADVLLGKSALSDSDRRFTEFVYRIETLERLNKEGKLPDSLYELCRKSVVDEFV